MKNRMDLAERVYRRLLREAGGVDLGDVEFSPDRTDGVRRDEPNTPAEEQLFDEIHKWISTATAAPDLGRKLKELIDDRKYGSFFRTPGAETVQRGMSMTHEELLQMLDRDPSEELPDSGVARGRFTVEMIGSVASWTKNPDVAANFSEEYVTRGRPYSVIVTARVGDNRGKFLDLEHVQELTGRWKGFLSEEEVLAVGPIRAAAVEWWRMSQ